MKFSKLIEPIQIGSMKLRNRTVMPGMGTNLASYDGTVSDIIVDYYARRANGGVGLIVTEVCAPEEEGRVIPGELEVTGTGFVPGLSRLVSAAHSGGSKIALQLAHGGCFASESVTGVPPKSPSGVGTALLPDDKPKEMSIEEIQELVKDYGMAAQRARMAGFDAVELHGAHGYMPLQFLSGYTNKRTDDYGGSLENRAKFPLELIEAIKEYAGQDFPVIYRLSCEEDVPDGLTPEEASQFAEWAQEAGVDAFNISVGTWDTRMNDFQQVMTGQERLEGKNITEGVSIGSWVPPIYVPRGNLIKYAEKIKQHVSIPVITAGSISPEIAEDAIKENKADLVCMGRQIIADPDYPNKLWADKPEEIRRCVRCNECLGSVLSYRALDCAVNAEAGKEHENFVRLNYVENKKKVLIAGGGPAGMEAAVTAASRGHEVTLYEQDDELGGMLRYLSIPQFKKDYQEFMDWQISELQRMNIEVKVATPVTKELIQKEKPDTVIVATGSKALNPRIPGIDGQNVHQNLDVLDGKIPEGKKIIVCGGGLVGAEVAMYLSEEYQKNVVMVEKLSTIVPELEIFSQWVVQSKLVELGIEVKVNHCIEVITGNGIECSNDDQNMEIDGDDIVIALGTKAEDSLVYDLSDEEIEVVTIGDAVEPRKVIHAIHEGYHAGRRI